MHIILAAICLLLLASEPVEAARPQIESVTRQQNGRTVELRGGPFGKPCDKCTVIADYGKFKYRLAVKKWGSKSIAVHLPDLGLKLKVSIVVKSSTGDSKPHAITILPHIVPGKTLEKLVKPKSVPGLVMHDFRSQDSLGEKGERQYQVSEAQTKCGNAGYLFDNAKLVLGKRTRFGQAKIVSAPQKGCSACAPVSIRYFYEPTGGLHYQLHVYRRKIEGICPAQLIQ